MVERIQKKIMAKNQVIFSGYQNAQLVILQTHKNAIRCQINAAGRKRDTVGPHCQEVPHPCIQPTAGADGKITVPWHL